MKLKAPPFIAFEHKRFVPCPPPLTSPAAWSVGGVLSLNPRSLAFVVSSLRSVARFPPRLPSPAQNTEWLSSTGCLDPLPIVLASFVLQVRLVWGIG